MPFGSRIVNAAFFAACLALAGVYALFIQAPAVGTFHDDGVYLVTAQALAEGRGYRIISLPGEPAQTKYPILFPWLVSLMWRVYPSFPENLVWLRMVPLGAAVAWLWLAWRLVRRLGASKQVAALMMLLTAASPWVVYLSTTLLAETLFAALVTGALLLIVRIYDGAWRSFEGLGAGVLMGAAVLTRTAGVGPAAAGLLALLIKRRWVASAQYCLGVLVLAAPWFWWTSLHASQPVVDPFYLAANYGSWNIVANYSWPDKLIVLKRNVLYAIVALSEFWGYTLRTLPGLVAALLCSALVISGLWRARTTPVAMVTGVYFAMLLAWVWPPGRFLVPLIPLFIWLAYVGAGPLKPLAGSLALALLIPAGLELWQLTIEVREKRSKWFASGDPDNWHAMSEQLEWVDRETPRDAILTGSYDPSYFLFTGRKASRADVLDPLRLYYNLHGGPGSSTQSPGGFRQHLLRLGADYVIVTPRDGLATAITHLSEASPGSLTPVARSATSGYVIYRVDRARLH